MTDGRGHVICGTMTNLFLVQGDGLITPRLARCGVAGTVRELVWERALALGIPLVERDIRTEELSRARGLFVTNALLGLLPVARLGSWRYDPGAAPTVLVDQVQQAVFEPEMQI
jgi:4-amino-4-deoxychorismate lyase